MGQTLSEQAKLMRPFSFLQLQGRNTDLDTTQQRHQQ
jgi:hypothetical protein